MPLPDNWKGVFYSQESSGDMLFDLNTEQLFAALQTQPGAQFLIAGAMFDLIHNGHVDPAMALGQLAQREYPTTPWTTIFVLNRTATEMALLGVSQVQVGHTINNVVARFFPGGLAVYPNVSIPEVDHVRV